MEIGSWWDDRIQSLRYPRTLTVNGTVTVAEEATLLLDETFVFVDGGNGATIDNSGRVVLLRPQEKDEDYEVLLAPVLREPDWLKGTGETAFSVFVEDEQGIAAAVEQNQDDENPQVVELRVLYDVPYQPSGEQESLCIERLTLWENQLRLDGPFALTVNGPIEGGGEIALANGASLTCPADCAPNVTGADRADNGDGTVTYTAAATGE